MDLSRPSESAIRRWVDDPSFDRGQSYHRQGRILNPRRQGETLKALCSGSSPQPYRVEIVLDSQGIVSGNCSCPQVTAAFVGAGDDWRTASRASLDLEDILELAGEYVQHGNWRNAATVYETVARGVLDNYGQVHDEEGELSRIVRRCTEGLAQCLGAVGDSAQREGLLWALFDCYRWDVDAGGYGRGDEVPGHILALANTEEKRKVAEWVRKALPEGDSWGVDYPGPPSEC